MDNIDSNTQQNIVNFKRLRPCNQAVAFARVSKREQAEGASHDAQLNAIRRYCAEHNLKIIQEIKLVESSTRGGRAEFHKMLDFVKKQKNKTAIIVHCIDRFQRSFKESAEIESMLKDDATEVHFYKESLVLTKSSSSADIMRWDMGILSGKMYVGALRDNVNRSMEYNWASGKWQGLTPIGYLNTVDSNKNKTVIIDPVRGPLVKKMFEEYATGLYSVKDMVEWAKRNNLLSRGTSRYSSRPLCKTAIDKALKNPFYYGVMHIKGNYIPHIYEHLIDKDLFDKVQEKLSGKTQIHAKSDYCSLDFALRGIFRCAKCGCAMSPEMHTKKNGKKYTYLKCSHVRGNCDQKPINEESVFQQIEDQLAGSFTFSEGALQALKSSVRKYIDKEADFNNGLKKQLETKLLHAQNRLDNALNLLFDGIIDKDIYEAKASKLKQEIAETEQELNKCSDNYAEIGNIIENIIEIAGNVRNLLRSSKTQEKRAILKLILSNSTIEGKKAWISLKKPFDLFLKSKGQTLWSGRKDSNLRHLGPKPSTLPD